MKRLALAISGSAVVMVAVFFICDVWRITETPCIFSSKNKMKPFGSFYEEIDLRSTRLLSYYAEMCPPLAITYVFN